MPIKVEDLTYMGQTAMVRATLEGERRWCGNRTEDVTGAPVNMGKHELLCTLLDKRTLGCHHITNQQRKEAHQCFLDEYVNFSLQVTKFSQAEVQKGIDKRATMAATAAAAVGGIVGEVVLKEEIPLRSSPATSSKAHPGQTTRTQVRSPMGRCRRLPRRSLR